MLSGLLMSYKIVSKLSNVKDKRKSIMVSRRGADSLHTSPHKIIKLFVSMFLVYPVLFLFFVSFIVGISNIVEIAVIVSLLCVPIIPPSIIAFYFLNRKLSFYIDQLIGKGGNADLSVITVFINKFPFRAAIILFIPFISGTFLAISIAYSRGIVVSIEQTLFLIILAEVPAGIVAFILYYYSKSLLYHSNRYIEFRPLSMFYKFSIPIISAILLLLNISNVIIYKFIYEDIINIQNYNKTLALNKTGMAINSFFENVL